MRNIDAGRVSEARSGRPFETATRTVGAIALTRAVSVCPAAAARAEAVALGETSAVAATAPPATAATPSVLPPPYSVPWQLRPVTVGTVIRSDTAVAFYDNAMGSGSTVATMLMGSYKLTSNLAPMVRLGFVQNGPPGTAPDGTSFINPVVGVTYSRKLGGSFRLAGFLGTTIPIGMGGGSTPEASASAADTAGIAARSGMDNSMFAVNYMAVIPGVGFAYIEHKLTIQAEATLFELFRVKGSDATSTSPDATRTNSTMGVHAGYFVLPMLSVGGELRYQRWLSTPTRIVKGVRSDIPSENMDTVSLAVGPRFHFQIGKTWLRPGISYAQVIDEPFSASNYRIVQIDVPVVF
jgi:hypothetical protein